MLKAQPKLNKDPPTNRKNWISLPINIDICDLFFNGYWSLVFNLFRRVTDIWIFLVRIKTDNKLNQNL